MECLELFYRNLPIKTNVLLKTDFNRIHIKPIQITLLNNKLMTNMILIILVINKVPRFLVLIIQKIIIYKTSFSQLHKQYLENVYA